MVAGGFRLFVSAVMFFIDHDQPHVLKRRKKSGTGSNHNSGSPLTDFVPGFPPLRHGLATVQNGKPDPLPEQSPAKTGYGLRGQGDFRNEDDGIFSFG
jgi:hypothetical protein